ncbi:MAG: lipoprotein [Enterobacter asburiae]|nr:lipoprotein [Enterobacter asburiae]
MKRFISVALLAALLAGCAHDSPCVPVYDDQGRLVHTNTCMKGTTQDNWETAGAIAGGAAAVAGLTLGIVWVQYFQISKKIALYIFTKLI